MTGTIPLYYGCPKISEYFDDRGIICFDTLEELQDIIKNLSIEDYTRRIEFVNENFELAKKYVIADDIIFDKLKELKLF